MSGPINNQVEALIRVTSRLIGVLDSEVEMLRAMRVTEIEDLQEEKRDLTILYEETIRSLAAQPDALAALEPALRMELSDLAGRFDNSLAENARAGQHLGILLVELGVGVTVTVTMITIFFVFAGQDH